MDWASILVGFVVGVLSTILTYEYRRWRERKTRISERRSQVVEQLSSELNKVITKWKFFKNTEEYHYDPGLTDFQNELGLLSDSLLDMVSRYEKLIPKNVYKEIVEVSDGLSKLSQHKFWVDGGRSWEAFLDKGDRLVGKCEKLKQRLS
jgi:hypothetical protein